MDRGQPPRRAARTRYARADVGARDGRVRRHARVPNPKQRNPKQNPKQHQAVHQETITARRSNVAVRRRSRGDEDWGGEDAKSVDERWRAPIRTDSTDDPSRAHATKREDGEREDGSPCGSVNSPASPAFHHGVRRSPILARGGARSREQPRRDRRRRELVWQSSTRTPQLDGATAVNIIAPTRVGRRRRATSATRVATTTTAETKHHHHDHDHDHTAGQHDDDHTTTAPPPRVARTSKAKTMNLSRLMM